MKGVLDSGLGGITTALALRENKPETSFVVLADQRNVPYGTKTKEELLSLGRKNIEWFKERDIHDVIVACNTLCSYAVSLLKEEYPDMNITDIISLTLKALKDIDFNSVLILSTPFTLKAGRYSEGLKDKEVYARSLEKLVPLIEENHSLEEIDRYLYEELKDIPAVDLVLLACTHYPLVKDSFIKLFPGAVMYDASLAVLKYEEFNKEDGEFTIYTTGKVKATSKQVKDIFRQDITVKKAVL